MELLQAEDFARYVGEVFSVVGTPFALPLARIELSDDPLPEGMRRRPFTLVFTGLKPGPVLPEGLYACDVGDGRAFDLYLAPIHTPAPDRQDYQALFG